MSLTDLSGRLFQKYLMQIAQSLVWKDEYSAMLAERECDAIATDLYTSSARKLLERYTVDELKTITDMSYDQFLKFRATADPAYIRFLNTFWGDVETGTKYEEPNTYYRMLYGKPPLHFDPKYGVYPNYNNPWGLDPNKSIHDAPINIIMMLEAEGGLDYYKDLIEKDKTFKYVEHMTRRRIYPFVARLAQKFDLLYIDESELSSLSRDFRDVYQQCRDFMVIRYYSEAYRYKEEYYEGLVGMAILFQTIQQMHVKYLEADITRDFYDLDSIRVIYDAYSVPFYEDIPTIYHQKIVKLMNRLLRYKGCNQVFFDLCSIFDYESLQLYKYYLVREHKFDENGRPIFKTNPDGSPDYNSMYNVFFSRALIDGVPFDDIIDKNNWLEYFPVTNADPFWINDDQLLQKIYQTEYNFTDTKYLGLQMVFSLTNLLFESGYFIQMIADNRNSVSAIRVSHNKLGTEIDLFTLVIYIHAIIYKRLGYEGNIPDTLEQRGRVLGFNFKDDINKIIEDVTTNEHLMTGDAGILLKILRDMQITNITSCSKVYENIKTLYRVIDDRILRCKDPDVYFAYKHLYKLLLTTEQISSIFRKSDGTIAETVSELLADLNITLSFRIADMNESDLIEELRYSLVALERAGSDLKYLQSYGGSHGEIISQYLYKLIRVFKSAKVDLVDFRTIYVIDGRCTNLIKLMVSLRLVSMSRAIPYSVLDLHDNIGLQRLKAYLKDTVQLKDESTQLYVAHIINDPSLAIGLQDIIASQVLDVKGPIAEDVLDLADHIARGILTTPIKEKPILSDKLITLNIERTDANA